MDVLVTIKPDELPDPVRYLVRNAPDEVSAAFYARDNFDDTVSVNTDEVLDVHDRHLACQINDVLTWRP